MGLHIISKKGLPKESYTQTANQNTALTYCSLAIPYRLLLFLLLWPGAILVFVLFQGSELVIKALGTRKLIKQNLKLLFAAPYVFLHPA